MRKGFHGVWMACALGLSALARGQAPETNALALSLEDAIGRALEHNRQLVKGALDLQGYRLAEERARETARGIRIVPEGSAGAGSDSENWRAGLGAEATGAYGTRVALGAAASQIAVDGAPTLRREEVRAEIEQPLFRNFGPLVQNEPIVAAGETLLAPVSTDPVRARYRFHDEDAPADTFNRREVAILRLMAGGYSNREIAGSLFLAEGTVKNYVSTILDKLDTRDRTRAVLKAITLRII